MNKFLIIPILIFVYIFLIDVLSQVSFQAESSAPTASSGYATIINIGQSVSVSVTRPYLFGLINLPTYTDALGNIGIYHDMFFTFIFNVLSNIMKFKGELKLNTGRIVEYKVSIGHFIKKLNLVDKTGLKETCPRCGTGTVEKHGRGSYTFLGPITYDTTYGSYKTSEKRQFLELIEELKNKK